MPEFPFDEIRKLESLKKRLAAELKGNLQIAVDIKLVEPKSIERSEGKAKRIIDLRKGKGYDFPAHRFLENEKGRLAAATRAVADAGVNMHALYLADTEDFGVARMLCDTPNKAAEKLTLAGWRAAVTPVMAVRVPDVPGGLASLLEFLDECDVNVEYGYCMSVEGGHAIDVLKVSGDEEIERKLADAGFAPVPRRMCTLSTSFTLHSGLNKHARAIACVLVFVLALTPVAGGVGNAYADVRKADIVMGETVDLSRLAVAQCPNIDAERAIVVDTDGTVYFERNADDAACIASVTKIMTGVVALDAVASGLTSLDSTITVSANAAAVGESSAGLQEGDTMTLKTALYALLVPSGNDAAIAIAESVGAALRSSGTASGDSGCEGVRCADERHGAKARLHEHGL